MTKRDWRRLGGKHKPYHIDQIDDDCYFILDYTPRGGYPASDDNQLVFDLKADPKAVAGQRRRHHIRLSVKNFAEALMKPITYYRQFFRHISLIPIPNSKSKDDPKYHNNLEVVGQMLESKFDQQVKLETPIVNKAARRKACQTGRRRDRQYINQLKANFRWLGLNNHPELIIIYDDVITSGAQFKAVKEFILSNLKNQPRPRIVGLFWAHTAKQPTLGPGYRI